MKLTKTFGQIDPSGNTTTINIQVGYDVKSNTVMEILHVYAYDSAQNIFIDITRIMMDKFWLEKKVGEIDWREVYSELKIDNKAA